MMQFKRVLSRIGLSTYIRTVCSNLNLSEILSTNFLLIPFSRLFASSSQINMEQQIKQNSNTFLVVGLGNSPFPKTRHSVGMMACDRLAQRHSLTWSKLTGRHGGQISDKIVLSPPSADVIHQSNEVDGKEGQEKMDQIVVAEIYLFKPKSLMNICGANVANAAKHVGVDVDHIYLVQDELDMVVGKAGLKLGGSTNGHRGVQSCVSSLRSSGVWPKEEDDKTILRRLRIGVGRPVSRSDVATYVLSNFPKDEIKSIHVAIDKGLDLMMQNIQKRVIDERCQEKT